MPRWTPASVLARLGPWNVVGVVAAAIYGLPALAYPFGNDQALHWYAGSGMLRGDLPFVTVISSKPIIAFLTHAVSVAVFGDHQWSIRVLELLTLLGCGWLIARLVRDPELPPGDGEVGLGAIVAVGMHYTFFDYWDTAHPEVWEGAALLGAAVVAFRDPQARRRAILTGVLVGVAFMIKYPAALAGLVPAAVVGWRAITEESPPRWLRLLISAGLFLAGAFAVIALCVLPFAIAGELTAMWEVLFEFTLKYADEAHPHRGVPRWLLPDHGGIAVAVSCAFALVGLALARERRSRRQWLVGSALVGLFLLAVQGIVAQGRYFDYHWIATAPFISGMTVWGLRMLWPRAGWPPMLAAVALVTTAFALGPRWGSFPEYDYRHHVDNVLDHLGGREDRATFLADYHGLNRLDHYGPMEEVAAIINAHKREGDALCVRGFATPIYQITSLRCPSRHVVEDVLPIGLPGWREEYRDVLARDPPAFVVTFRDRPTDVAALLRDGYREIGSVGLFQVMERR